MADHVLQFLFHGLTGFRMPFACFPTYQANSCNLYLNVWQAMSTLQNWEFDVKHISLDGSSNNRAFIRMLFPGDPMDSKLLIENRSNPFKKKAVIPDPSHVIKKIRKSIFSSGTGAGYTRSLSYQKEDIVWKQWEDAYEWCQNRIVNPIASHPKLTKDHIYLSEPGKMRNALAKEVLNDQMLYLFEAYQKSLPEEQAINISSTIQLLQQTSTIIRNFSDQRPITETSDPRLIQNKAVLTWFTDWEHTASSPNNLMAAECRQGLNWMLQGIESLVTITRKGCQYILVTSTVML